MKNKGRLVRISDEVFECLQGVALENKMPFASFDAVMRVALGIPQRAKKKRIKQSEIGQGNGQGKDRPTETGTNLV